jgi:HEPN domain-containing protein
MAEDDVAALLLAAAKRDRQAFRALVAIPDMNDAVIGFHAQQCIEKALKSVLAHARIAFRRTHSIAELLELLQDSGIEPPNSDRLDVLDPYAVDARYSLLEPVTFDRDRASRAVEQVIAWAEAQLAAPLKRGET